jgi:TetR/AcrR family transcriptional repressor of nem operon
MKVTKAQATENREAIERAAAALVRERGFDQMSVAGVAAAAGLTHGALYSHYKSKEALTQAATARAFEDTLSQLGGLSVREFVSHYLTAAHRDHPGLGCPNAALVTEVWRQPAATQEAFRDGLKRYVETIARALAKGGDPSDSDRSDGDPQHEAKALTLLAAMAGAMALSRAINGVDPSCSDAILTDVSTQLARFIGETDAPAAADPPRKKTGRTRSGAAD